MKERQTFTPENGQEKIDDTELQERSKELLEKARHEAARAKNEHRENLDELRHEIEEHSNLAAEISSTEKSAQEEPEGAQTYWYSSEYRQHAYNQMLKKVQAKLPTSQKLVSKVIHQKTIESVSELGSKTIARPSGVLFGSIFSFIASFVTYFFSKRYGYDMTYSIFIFSFLGGFILGLLLELTLKGVRNILSRN